MTYRPQTTAIRAQNAYTHEKEHTTPLYLTSSFIFDDAEEMRAAFSDEIDANIYSRYSNPNVDELVRKMALLEGSESGWATATGMAAVFTTFAALLQSGDHIVSSRAVFGSTYNLFVNVFPKWGITCDYADATDYEAYERLIKPQTKILYIETPSNPALEIIDLERIGRICKEKGVLLVVDNCFATPVLQRPLEFGADISIHSATKYIDGQGRVLGGLILSSNDIVSRIEAFARHSGPAMSPFNAWLFSKSLETLDVRMERHCRSALEIAQRLESRPEVEYVKYPFLESHPQFQIAHKQMSAGGGVITFQLDGGVTAGRKFLNALRLFSLTPNLGDTRSIATHPASTTHSKLKPEERELVGITDGLVRLSIGLEHREDLWEDLLRALEVSGR